MAENTGKKSSHEIVRLGTVCLAFIVGWAITIAGFVVPPLGEIDNSVLVVLGQSLAYASAGLGLKDYVDVKTRQNFNEYYKEREKEVE